MLFTPLGLDHIVLQVKDQAAQQKFYTEVLGCEVARVNPAISLVQLRFGEHMIDLIPGTGPGDRSDKRGLDHFCLSIRCDDLIALAAELKAKGVRLDGEIVPRTGAYGRSPSLYLFDPEGYSVELKPRDLPSESK
jgi:glyoxylase I family protein